MGRLMPPDTSNEAKVCRRSWMLGDVLVEIALSEVGDRRRGPALVSLLQRITAGVYLALQTLGFIAGGSDAPGRIVADEVAPAPPLEGVVKCVKVLRPLSRT